MKDRLISILGWYGVGAIILSYALLNLKMIQIEDLGYILLNLTGALGIMIDAANDRDYQPVVLNVFWALIAIWGLIQIII